MIHDFLMDVHKIVKARGGAILKIVVHIFV